MIIKELDIEDVYEIQLKTIADERGNFTRTFDDKIFSKFNLSIKWVQENHSISLKKNTIRGLHFQFPPFSETKLIKVVKGEIYDVYVDLRDKSPTFGKWGSIILSSNNNKMILIPRGFAHGYCTLSDDCEILYKVDNYYNPHKESGIIWHDPTLSINFPITVHKPITSVKDSQLQTFETFIKVYGSLVTEELTDKKTLYYKDKNLD